MVLVLVAEKAWRCSTTEGEQQEPVPSTRTGAEEEVARDAIQEVLGFAAVDNVNGGEKKQQLSSSSPLSSDRNSLPTRILPKQSRTFSSAQDFRPCRARRRYSKADTTSLATHIWSQRESEPGFNNFSTNSGGRKLYRHQTAAIQAALSEEHDDLYGTWS
jgi:hypothetical protein